MGGNMKFRISRASDGNPYFPRTGPKVEQAYQEGEDWYIDIKTLEDLMQLIDDCGEELIIGNSEIIIYDDRVE
jgi:hypothetical protein